MNALGLERFDGSAMDNVLSFAHSMGFVYDMNYLPWWRRLFYLWRFRKMGTILHLMPQFFSLDRAMAYYACAKKEGGIYELGDSFLFALTHERVAGSRIDLTMTATCTRDFEKENTNKTVWRGSINEVNLLYCPEMNIFVSYGQVYNIIVFLRGKKSEYDDWCYFRDNY